ncbi:hypothetical protein Leryth_008299 [Lithospermum erythrorhizon]|nr:hypothetical protein Leryth_008299 [Lithospermum erythrorhizon]
MAARLLLLASVLCSTLLISTSSSTSDLQILAADRNIDLTSHIVRVYLTLKVENSGAAPVSEVLLSFSPTEARQLALVNAAIPIGKKKKKYQPLDVNPTDRPDAPNGTKYYMISLLKPLNKGETITIETHYIMTHSLEPFPLEISQSESQLVYYRDSAIVLSPYPIKQQVTLLKTPSNKVESFTRMEPTSHAGTQLKYGPYEDRAPFSYSPIMVHFENNNPFAVIEELVREIEISHWGSIQITEHYKLLHGGARQKGGFSRVDYQNQPAFNGLSSFKHLHAELPPRVHSVYYRDEIGNISSSRLRISSKKSDLVVLPRYPLFGGWKSTFVIGYGVPLQDFLFESADGSRYLNYTFGCAFVDTIVDKLIDKVVLPEGSTDASAIFSFSAEQRLEKKYSYLDVVGRTVLVLEKRNVVPEHNIPFQVHYNFKQAYMLAEPLMLISVFLLFFVTCIAYLHIDFSISK